MNVLKKIDFATAATLDKQEHLSKEIVTRLTNAKSSSLRGKRPVASFVELMNWVDRNFGSFLVEKGLAAKRIRVVHNRIIMDGQFVHFCDEQKIKIECLYNDSVISWKTEQNYEKYFIQGVFRVTTRTFSFIHSGLFHKGNQNEDEVSFFNIVPVSGYDQYISLRNSFDEWIKQRDRQNLQIKVIEGEDVPYTQEVSWDSLFLPVSLKEEIKNCVETFLVSKDFYEDSKIPWKRGILLWGEPGCGKTSLIRTVISNYNFKPVTISPGAGDGALKDAFSYAESQSPALLYFEDLDSMFQTVNVQQFLSLMDGVTTRNGLLIIGTANSLASFQANITDRPSRFDRKYEIPLPDKAMCSKYLMKWFGSILNKEKILELADLAFKYKFSYAYLKEFYISSVYEALAHNRKTPNLANVNRALNGVMKDKNIGRGRKNIGLGRHLA